jgi:uncharacterized ubiquitin-like protein YukD
MTIVLNKSETSSELISIFGLLCTDEKTVKKIIDAIIFSQLDFYADMVMDCSIVPSKEEIEDTFNCEAFNESTQKYIIDITNNLRDALLTQFNKLTIKSNVKAMLFDEDGRLEDVTIHTTAK